MLMSHDLAADISLPVTDLPGLAGSGLAIGPSGTPILYPRTGNFAGDLMLVEGYFR